MFVIVPQRTATARGSRPDLDLRFEKVGACSQDFFLNQFDKFGGCHRPAAGVGETKLA